MVLLHSLHALREWQHDHAWSSLQTGFVPTMGALHEGHASLIRQASARCELVVVSILVNPTQFNKTDDFESYPRTLDRDAAFAAEAGADAIFAPSADELYGGTPQAPAVDWGPLTNAYEGAHRPGHFDGVVAVVDLLLEAVKPGLAVFGEKDLQQVAVVNRLVRERHPETAVVVGDLVRDEDGLALSSRNARLNADGLETAQKLNRALRSIQQLCAAGKAVELALEEVRAQLQSDPKVTLEYLDVVDARTFHPRRVPNEGQVVVAAEVQGVRLIDNAPLRT